MACGRHWGRNTIKYDWSRNASAPLPRSKSPPTTNSPMCPPTAARPWRNNTACHLRAGSVARAHDMLCADVNRTRWTTVSGFPRQKAPSLDLVGTTSTDEPVGYLNNWRPEESADTDITEMRLAPTRCPHLTPRTWAHQAHPARGPSKPSPSAHSRVLNQACKLSRPTATTSNHARYAMVSSWDSGR